MTTGIESLLTGLLFNSVGLIQGEVFEIFFFFFFKYFIILSAVMVVISSNSVYSVFYLIALFINVSILVISLGAEFLGIMFIIVYVGAIAVLFLFVVMMLNVNNLEYYPKLYFKIYFTTSFIILVIFTIYLNKYVYPDFGFHHFHNFKILPYHYLPYSFSYVEWTNLIFASDNILVLGSLLYTYYYHLFILSGFILLVAMLSSITLTLNPTNLSLKSQDKYLQISRKISKSVFLRKFN